MSAILCGLLKDVLVIRFAFVSLLTFAVLGGVFFLSSSHAELNAEPEAPSKAEVLFR